MKVNLTVSQALTIIDAVRESKNQDYGDNDPINKHLETIAKKIEKELKNK